MPTELARGRIVVRPHNSQHLSHRRCSKPRGVCRARKGSDMAEHVCGMRQSLVGCVDQLAVSPNPTLFRHVIEEAEGQAGSVYGRQMYEIMRYWDDDHPEWNAEEHDFAAAWR